jgi:hypothetical protein
MFLALSVWSLCTIRPWSLLHAAWLLIVLEMAAGAAVWWTYSHYHAAITCLCYFVFVDGLRRAFILGRGTCWPRSLRPRHLILAFSLLIPAISLAVDLLGPPSAKAPQTPAVVSSSSMLTRSELLTFLEHQERPAIAFVSYDSSVELHDEWVYNSADLESQRVVLAHDRGPEENPLSMGDFPSRDSWRVQVTKQGATLCRYNEAHGISSCAKPPPK